MQRKKMRDNEVKKKNIKIKRKKGNNFNNYLIIQLLE